jgi:uncharacterized protein (DUF1015 family)
VEDRLQLTKATNANTGVVFCIHSANIAKLLEKNKTKENLLFDFVDSDGGRQRLFRLSDGKDVAALQNALNRQQVTIADGHHRYETALRYKKIRRGAGGSDYVMVSLVSANDPGIALFSTHRLVYGLKADVLRNLDEKLKKDFEINHFPSIQELADAMPAKQVFGLWNKMDGKVFTAELKNESAMDEFFPKESPLRKLDVSILHKRILEKTLGITEEMQSANHCIDYVKGTDAALKKARSSKYQLICLQNPPSISDVIAVASAGQRMPRKSTFFYPKFWSGLILRVLE